MRHAAADTQEHIMTDERHETGPDTEQRGPVEEQDKRYAEQLGKRSRWPIGDTNVGTGTLKPTDDIGTGGPADEVPVERGSVDRAEERVDTSAGGGLNQAATQAAGLPGDAARHLPGTGDLGAAAGDDLGAGLGKTRGTGRQHPRGQVTGSGGTRGSGAGTGHLEDTPG